jgi:hypothetical protein
MNPEYEAWLSRLKVGDEVIIESFAMDRLLGREIETIKRVMKDQTVIIRGYPPFKNGEYVLCDSFKFPTRIVPITTARLEYIERNELCDSLWKVIKNKSLSLDQLRDIKKIIDQKKVYRL